MAIIDAETQRRVEYELDVECPECGQVNAMRVTTEDESAVKVSDCEYCGKEFAYRPCFKVSATVYALKRRPNRPRKQAAA